MARRKKISKAVRFDVFNRDGFKCRYCGRSQEDGAVLHLDHVLAVARGGGNDAANLVTACADCNLGKSDKKLLKDLQANLDEVEKLRVQLADAEKRAAVAEALADERAQRIEDLRGLLPAWPAGQAARKNPEFIQKEFAQ